MVYFRGGDIGSTTQEACDEFLPLQTNHDCLLRSGKVYEISTSWWRGMFPLAFIEVDCARLYTDATCSSDLAES